MPSKRPDHSKSRRRRKPGLSPIDHLAIDSVDYWHDLPKAKSVRREDIHGLKYIEMLIPLIESLHGEQAARDKANNRDLYFDKYCRLVLLYMFNTTVTSLRAIALASEVAKVHAGRGGIRTSLGSLSDASV